MELVRRRELLRAGYVRSEVRRRVRAGELVAVRRGAYARGALPDSPDDVHRLRIVAAFPELAPGSVISHASAAVLHGLPTWGLPLDRVQATRARRSGARRDPALHLHATPLDPTEVVELDGIPVTDVARTVTDLARSLPFEQAVVVADRALQLGLTGPTGLAAAVAAATGRPGAPQARRVLAFADGRSESVGESRSRVAIAAAGLPTPVLQWEVTSSRGRRVGRVDFGWPDHGVVGEFDGRVKYGRLLRPGQQPGDAVYAEKLREDALRDTGLRVVRWTWADLDPFAPVADRLRRTLA